jgi:hypothetical protein
MAVEIILALIAFAAVVAGVFGEAHGRPQKGPKSIGRWGRVALVVGVLAVVFSIVKIVVDSKERKELHDLLLAQKSELRDLSRIASQVPLKPTDFVINVLAEYRDAPEGGLPASVTISGHLGDDSFHGELAYTNTIDEIPGGGRGRGYLRYRYRTNNLLFTEGLKQFPNLNSIDGQLFEMTIDPKGFHGYPHFTIDLYVPGRMFPMGIGSDGHFVKVLSFKE